MANHEIICNWEGEKLLFKGMDVDGHEVFMDSNRPNLGDNKGFRPTQLLLIGLAGCMGMSVKGFLDKNGVKVNSFEMKVTGELDMDNKPKIYNGARVLFHLKGEDLNRSQIEKTIKVAEERYCSVSAMLGEVFDIEFILELD